MVRIGFERRSRACPIHGSVRPASLAPDPDLAPRVELSFRDTREVSGLCPYWVRVTQVDQHRAWSSPIYVQRQAATT